MTLQDAQASNDVVTGTILVSSKYAYVLFDSGASHSFVSTKFVKKHDMLIEPIDTDLCVDTPIGSTLVVDHTYKSCSIIIEDRELLVDLMVMDMHDFEDRKSTRLNSSHSGESRMPSSA